MPQLISAATGATVDFAVSELTDAQVSGLITSKLTSTWGKYVYLQDVNRAQGTCTFNKYETDADGYRNWNSAQLHECAFTLGDNYDVAFGEAKAVIAVTTYEKVGDTASFSVQRKTGHLPTARFSVTSADRYEKDGHAIYPKSLLFVAGDYPDKNFSMQPSELIAAAENWQTVAGNVQHTDFLRGKAAFIDEVWTENEGNVLRGVVKVPLALDQMLSDAEKGISMEWTRAGKLADGFALCTNPRVSQAALMSLDAEISNPPAALANSAQKTEETMPEPTTAAAPETEPATVASLWDKVKALFTSAGVAVDSAAQIAAAKEAAVLAEAKSFALAEFSENRCTPAELPGLETQYAQAARDDAAHPTSVHFATEGGNQTGSRVDALKARQSLRNPAGVAQLTQEVLDDGQVLFNDNKSAGRKSSNSKAPDSQSIYRRANFGAGAQDK